jgi:meso-butanediol dehydrogenase/(S,S)-butanediol dehydrogenase/diacetyl reductase
MAGDRKVAIVTGAGQGIGKAVALALAEDGVDVVLAEINPETAHAAAKDVEKLGAAILVQEADVTKKSSVEAMVAATMERFGLHRGAGASSL